MESSNLSKDEIYLNYLRDKLNGFDTERKRIKEFNIKARENKFEPIDYKILNNISTKAGRLRNKIKLLESWKSLENKEYQLNNNINVIENYKLKQLELYFKEQPSFLIIKYLTTKDFNWDKNKNCWFVELTKNNLNNLKELRKLI